MFKAYGMGLQEKDFELIRKIVRVVTIEHVSIKDLRYYDLKLENTTDDVLFIFGDKASRSIKNIKAKEIIHLPEVSALHQDTGTQEKRREAFKKLNLLSSILEADTVEPGAESELKDPVPDLKLSDLKTLESTLREKEVSRWLTTTANGKTVQITITPETTEADINITFGELYALKIAMDALDVKEFTVVYNNKADKRNNKESDT